MKLLFLSVLIFVSTQSLGQFLSSSRGIGFGAGYQIDILGRNLENFDNSGQMQSIGFFVQPKEFIQIGIQRNIIQSNKNQFYTSSLFGQVSLPIFNGIVIMRNTWSGRRSNIPIGTLKINPTFLVNHYFTKKDFNYVQDYNSSGGGLQLQFQPNRSKYRNSEFRQTSLYLLVKKSQNPSNFIPNQFAPNLWFFGTKLDISIFKMR